MKEKKIFLSITELSIAGFLVLSLYLGTLFGQESERTGQELEKLKYNVDVNARVIPVFAIDSKGDPVYDLKEEDIQLYVNGKPLKIAAFITYAFSSQEKRGIVAKRKDNLIKKVPKRIIFIIIDSIFNSTSGLKRSKKIATEIVEKGSPEDRFILLENNRGGGLRYVFGPEKNKKKLADAILKMEKLAESRKKMRNDLRLGTFYSSEDRGPYKEIVNKRISDIIKRQRKKEIQNEKMRDRNDLKHFRHSLSNLRYALKTITLPKIVYLISEGIQSGSLVTDKLSTKSFYFDYLKETAKSINSGGSMLHVINSKRPRLTDEPNSTGKESLKYMADESGGTYFGGSDVQHIVKRVKKCSSAYYELFFYPEAEPKKKIPAKIRIKCKRKGVKMRSIQYSEHDRPYRKMNKIEKRTFVLDIVQGGMWSNMTAKAKKVKYRKLERKKIKSGIIQTISVKLPAIMRDHKVDIFVLESDPKTQKTDFLKISTVVTDKISLEVPIKKNRIQYFAIIEPTKTVCIYNRI